MDHTWIRVLVVVTLVWLALQVSPVAWAVEPDLSFDPTSGVVGDPVTITGSGWFPGDGEVEIYLPDTGPDTHEPWVTAVVEKSGEFRTTRNVPNLPMGEGSFFACQSCTFDAGDAPPSDSATFDVQPAGSLGPPALQLGQAEGATGIVISVTGSGWSAPDLVHLYVSREESSDEGNQLVAITPEDDDTIGSGWSIKVPPRPAGRYTFFACQQCGTGEKELSAEAAFEIKEKAVEPLAQPQLTLDPTKASVGQDVTANGVGWSDDAGPASVYADEAAFRNGADPLATGQVTRGLFAITITVPDREVDSLTVFACQNCGKPDLQASADLEIEAAVPPSARLQVLPGTGRRGAEVRVTGTGWRDEDVRLFARRNGDSPGVALGRATVEDGAFDRMVTVPSIGLGRIQILGCQGCGSSEALADTEPFTVVAAPLDGPWLGVDPGAAERGETITVSGTGWLAEAGEVTVYLKSVGTDDRNVWFRETPGRDNTFTTNVEAPDRDPGGYRVVACQRCDEGPGHPRAATAFQIEDEFPPRWWGAGLGALLLLVLVAWLLLRGGRARPPARPDPGPHPQVEQPRLRPIGDDTFEVEVGAPSGGRDRIDPSGLDVIGRPDPGRLSDQVEVSP